MIKSIGIQNFESHKDTQIDFGPGVNVLVGESEHGKSAVLRALNWTITNRPAGDAFRSHWGGDTKVMVIVADSPKQETDKIIKIKGNKTNEYLMESLRPEMLLEGKKSRSMVFKAIKQDVPEEITEALNLLPVNVQTQFDPHFLLPPVSPGEVARRLNEVVDLNVIDRTQSNINLGIRDANRHIREGQGKLADAEQSLKGWDWLDGAETDLAELEKLSGRAEGLRTRESELNRLVHEIGEIEGNLTELKDLPGKGELEDLERLCAHGNVLRENVDKLSGLLESVKLTSADLTATKGDLKQSQERFEKIFPDTCVLCGQEVEKWKPIKNYEGIYEISSLGRVRSYYEINNSLGQIRKTNTVSKFKTLSTDMDGYKRVNLYAKDKGLKPVNKSVHILVLNAFIGECPKDKEGSHLDGDITNNRLSNLQWENHLDNESRKIIHGTRPMGEKHKSSKLTETDILDIRNSYIKYKVTQKQLAEKYNVCENNIYLIVNNKAWRHI